jgi:uncharacterized protein (DUF1330 family)
VPGRETELSEYEDRVLAFLPDHGARIVQRVRAVDPAAAPLEVQVIEFPSEAALEAYLADPRRAALADRRERAVARTEVVRVAVV